MQLLNRLSEFDKILLEKENLNDETCNAFGLNHANSIIEKVQDAISKWGAIAIDCSVSKETS